MIWHHVHEIRCNHANQQNCSHFVPKLSKSLPREALKYYHHNYKQAMGEKLFNEKSIGQSNKRRGRRRRRVEFDFSFKLLFLSILFTTTATLLTIPKATSGDNSNNLMIAQQANRNSGQFQLSQLCAGRSQFGITKRVEGAVLESLGDSDINCTITFKTKMSEQHFAIRFEELKLGCNDHLKLFDSDLDYGQRSIKDFSCKDNLASVQIMKTTGTFLTIKFSTDEKTLKNNGFRLVLTAIFDATLKYDCPADYTYCYNRLCISRQLFCDDVNHCLDNSDEINCNRPPANSGSMFPNADLSLTNAVGLLVVIILVIFTCVILCISTIYCKRESHYAQYQHQLTRAIGVPLQTSSSVMFANQHQPQYHYFQASPYITPQHHATLTSAGYSTLPINLTRQQQQQHQAFQNPFNQQQQQPIVTKQNAEYLMMAGLTPTSIAAIQPGPPTLQTNLFLPTSQSILAAPAGLRFQANQNQLAQSAARQQSSPHQAPAPPPPPSAHEPRRS